MTCLGTRTSRNHLSILGNFAYYLARETSLIVTVQEKPRHVEILPTPWCLERIRAYLDDPPTLPRPCLARRTEARFPWVLSSKAPVAHSYEEATAVGQGMNAMQLLCVLVAFYH